LSSVLLQKHSLYELLGVDAACVDGELESRCEMLIESVIEAASRAIGKRREKLEILAQSLGRLRPLWGDPVKRARYDLRWNYVRAEERLVEAVRGSGVHAHVLAGIWLDLYPERVREAEACVRAAGVSLTARNEAVRAAMDLDPFSKRWRRELAALWDTGGAMLDPILDGPLKRGDVRVVRGSLADLPIKAMVESLILEETDADIELRVGADVLGTVGIAQGAIVLATSMKRTGLDALRAVMSVREGLFQIRYAAPPEERRNMLMPAREFLWPSFQ